MSFEFDFPDFLENAEELLVRDDDWTGTFCRTRMSSEGCPVFSKGKGSEETWQLKKVDGSWTFLNFRYKIWHRKERYDHQNACWKSVNNTYKPISIKVSKWLRSPKMAVDESWGDKLLRSMWEQGIGCNIKIELQDGQEIDAHKALFLATCPESKGELDTGIMAAGSDMIAILDVDPDVVKGFVKALYYGEFENPKLLPGIALLADRYNTEQLMLKVVEAMPEALKSEGPEFYFEVLEALKKLPNTGSKREMKAMLYSMNKDISEDIFYKRLGLG